MGLTPSHFSNWFNSKIWSQIMTYSCIALWLPGLISNLERRSNHQHWWDWICKTSDTKLKIFITCWQICWDSSFKCTNHKNHRTVWSWLDFLTTAVHALFSSWSFCCSCLVCVEIFYYCTCPPLTLYHHFGTNLGRSFSSDPHYF